MNCDEGDLETNRNGGMKRDKVRERKNINKEVEKNTLVKVRKKI